MHISTSRFVLKNRFWIIFTMILAIGLVLTACGPTSPPEEPAKPAPEEQEGQEPVEKPAEPEPEAAPTATPVPPEPTPTEVPPTPTEVPPTPAPLMILEYPIPASLLIADVDFVNADTGWVVGFIETDDDTNPLAIFHTQDGGLTWIEQKTGLGDGFVSTVVFKDEVTGFAGGQTWGGDIPTLILYTQDAGQRWTRANLPQVFGSVENIYLAPDGTVWSVGADFGNFASLLMQSEDGIDWAFVDHPSHEEARLNSIFFPTEMVGYAVGVVGWENPIPMVIKTEDGGETWAELPNPVETGDLLDVYFHDADHGFTVGSSGDFGVIAETTDGGATWAVSTYTGSYIGYQRVFYAKMIELEMAFGNLCTEAECQGVAYLRGQDDWHEFLRTNHNYCGAEYGSLIICANAPERGGQPSLLVISTEEMQKLKGISEPPAVEIVIPPGAGAAAPEPEVGLFGFVSTRENNEDIYLQNMDGTGLTRLTEHVANDNHITFSPDGSQIAFASKRDGNYEVYLMNLDGSEKTNLTNNSAGDWPYSWSPDGNRIAFVSNRDGNYEVYTMLADGTDVVRLTNNPAADFCAAAWSPDGKQIAWTSTRDGNNEIYVMNAVDGAEPTRLTNMGASDSCPRWSPDGMKLIFETDRDGNYEVYTINADGSNPVNLTNNTADDENPSWSSDGKYFIFMTTRAGNPEIYYANADGSNPQRLTDYPDTDRWPRFHPGSP